MDSRWRSALLKCVGGSGPNNLRARAEGEGGCGAWLLLPAHRTATVVRRECFDRTGRTESMPRGRQLSLPFLATGCSAFFV